MKQFLQQDALKLNDTFEKKIEMVEIVRGSGFVRAGDEFGSYAQFNVAYGEAAGVRLNGRREIEGYLSRIGLTFIEQGDTKIIIKVRDEVGDMLYNYYLANDEPAISRMNHTWQGESREKINQFLRDKPWEKVEGRLRYSDYGFSNGTASALFCAMPETRLYEISEVDFEINLPEDLLWTVDEKFLIRGLVGDNKRVNISCVCGKQVKMYVVQALESGASLSCRSCSVRTTDFAAFYQSIADEGYTIIEDIEDARPTGLSRITLQCSNPSHQEYSTFQHRWVNGGARCPSCSKHHVGEQKTREFLQSKNIEFSEQVKFDGLVGIGGRQLSYDFQIELNGQSILLELDGRQHFKSVEAWGGEAALQRNIEHDQLKDDFAVQNDLRLVRIQNVNSNYDFILNSLNELLNGSETNHYGNLYK